MCRKKIDNINKKNQHNENFIKTEIFQLCLLVIAIILAITAIFAFINGNITYGIYNILWMGCEVVFFSMNKKFIQTYQDNANDDAFIEKACEFLYNYNRKQVLKHGAKAILGCGEYTINVEEFRNYMKEE